MKIAILPIGFFDIIPRNTTSKLYVYINSKKHKVLGIISMDQIVIEITNNNDILYPVYLFGNGINCPQTIVDLAKISNTLPTDIISRLSYRINKIYINK